MEAKTPAGIDIERNYVTVTACMREFTANSPSFSYIKAMQTETPPYDGTGLCSYRVRGVDGSFVEHLTVESYTVVICQQSYLLLLVFHYPLTLSFQA